jgi:hypothetical protein
LAKGKTLQLNQDVLLSNQGLNLAARAKAQQPTDTGERVGVDEFKANRDHYSDSGISLISKGTRLRCVKLEKVFSSEYSHYIVLVEILDGARQGTITSIPVTGDPRTKGTLRLNCNFLDVGAVIGR